MAWMKGMDIPPYRYDLIQGFFSRRLFPWLFARVEIEPEHLKKWRRFVSKGIVIPLLDSPSCIDFLVLYHLYRRKGGIYPKFPIGRSMLPWVSFRGWRTYFKAYFLWVFKKVFLFDPFYPGGEGDLEKLGRVPFTLDIHLAGAYLQRGVSFRATPLEAIIRYQRKCPHPIYLVPHLIVYDVFPPTEKKSLYTAFWGELAAPRWTMRLKHLMLRRVIQVRVGAPIDVQRFIRQFPSLEDAALARELRQAAETIFDKKLRGITGPPLPSRDRMVTQILEDPGLWKLLGGMADTVKKPIEELAREARNYAYEIASDLRPSYVKQWEKILRWVWQSLYDGVDVNLDIQQRLRRIARNYPVVYVPSHKSHVDYFLLSYVLYRMNLPLPLIAAGINLSFWPVGPIFRRSGAFFIRRSFRDNPLYGEVFYLYLRELIREGVPIEFFIEGGRSRTGKLVLPKKGMISMIFRAYFEKVARDIYVVPTAVSYERIVEEEGYVRELKGDEKQKERTRDLVRLRKIFKKRYGTVFVRFGSPISLKRYLRSGGIEALPDSTDQRRALYQSVADDIIRAIQKVMCVTPSSLVAAALLSMGSRSIRLSEIIETARLYLTLLKELEVDFPFTDDVKHSFVRAVELFAQDGVLREGKAVDSGDPRYFVSPEKRIHLEFSKNMMVMHLVPLSLLAWTAFLPSGVLPKTPFQTYSFLSDLFKFEFLLPSDHPTHGYRLGQILLKDLSAKEVQKIRHLTLSAVEGYYAGATCLIRRAWDQRVDERKLVQEMIRWGREMVKTAQIQCPEAITSATLQGWLRTAYDKGILETEKNPPAHRRRDARRVVKGKHFREAETIVQLLDQLLFLHG